MFTALKTWMDGKKTKIAAIAMFLHGFVGLIMNYLDPTNAYAVPPHESVNNMIDALAVWGFRSVIGDYFKNAVK